MTTEIFSFDEEDLVAPQATSADALSTDYLLTDDLNRLVLHDKFLDTPPKSRPISIKSPRSSTPDFRPDASREDVVASYKSSLAPKFGTSFEVGIDRTYVSSEAESRRKPKPADFEPIKVLGQGAYGKVLLVRSRVSGKLYAQKQLRKASMIVEQKMIDQTKTEKSILESVRHPFIVRLFYALQDNDKLYLILEYAQGGELFTHLAAEKMFSEEVTAFYTAEMALALEHLHKNVGVVYRDLKPENCLLDSDGHLVLTDFGLSKVAQDGSTCNSLLGTPEYMAPEILSGLEYDYSVDWWSLGAVCYDLMTGNPPFTGKTHKKIVDKIKKQTLPLPYYLTVDAKDLLRKLLAKDPAKRLCYKDMDKIKKHTFFRKINWDLLEKRDPSVIPPIVPVITDPILAENFSREFTEMQLSPVSSYEPTKDDVFKGFSFTASFVEPTFLKS